MWIDVGAWGEARDAGVPSGAWGAEQATRAPAKGAEEVRARSLAEAAARRRRPASRATRAATVSVVPAYRAAEKPSNKRLIRNALRHVCLAGAANAPALRAAEAALDDVPPDVATIFVILFRENVSPHKYRARTRCGGTRRGAGKVGEDSRRGGTVVRRAGDGGVHDEVRQRDEGVQTDGDIGGDAADGSGDVREAIVDERDVNRDAEDVNATRRM